MISGERSSRLTTKIELVEVRELTESTDWFLPFHPTQHESAPCQLTAPPTRLSTSGTATGFFLGLGSSTALCKLIWAEAFERHVPNLLRFGAWLGLEALEGSGGALVHELVRKGGRLVRSSLDNHPAATRTTCVTHPRVPHPRVSIQVPAMGRQPIMYGGMPGLFSNSCITPVRHD